MLPNTILFLFLKSYIGPMIRVLVVDDHHESCQLIIEELKAGNLINVVGEAETSDQALQQSEKLLPDVVLLDLHMPGMLTPLNLIKKSVALRNVKVLVLAAISNGAEVQDILEAGASGYILKSDPSVLIRMSILMVARGAKNIISPALPRQINHLTSQERLILRQITRTNKPAKAALALGINESQLSATLSQVAEKLDLGTIANLTKWAKKNGF